MLYQHTAACDIADDLRDMCDACRMEYEAWLDEREDALPPSSAPTPSVDYRPLTPTPRRPTLTLLRCN